MRDIAHSVVDCFIDVNAQIEEWKWVIRSVAKGKVYYGQQIMMHLADSLQAPETGEAGSVSHLRSKRELEILRLKASEYSTNRIADQLFISGKTVESHGRQLFQKLGVKNSVGLTKAAV